jgi:cyclopropane-fatty-acyl-phospholipid synthase
MTRAQGIVENLLDLAGVKVDGPNPWDIQVNDDRFYARVLKDKNLGLGESYMDGWWDCDRLDEFMHRIIACRLDQKVQGSIRLLLSTMRGRLFNLQSKRGARKVAREHYDLDNGLFMSFLDPYNQYSCAYFNGTNDLRQAQINKIELICRKIGIQEGDSVLDVGFGWGGFAKYVAEHYGCTVTGINISLEQIKYAKEFCKDLPVAIVRCDYREISGAFDKIVSVGMFEHVGFKNYRAFLKVAHDCLKDDGVFLLHTIGGNETEAKTDPWIMKYIFPNSVLPSVSQIASACEGLFLLEDLHNLGPHYDRTLMAWNANFQEAWPHIRHKYDERFKRMWEYYLLSCAAAFRARYIHVWQIVFTKYGSRQPQCRFT